jgi:hypothetical protein
LKQHENEIKTLNPDKITASHRDVAPRSVVTREKLDSSDSKSCAA